MKDKVTGTDHPVVDPRPQAELSHHPERARPTPQDGGLHLPVLRTIKGQARFPSKAGQPVLAVVAPQVRLAR
jgi:hypothetical protein